MGISEKQAGTIRLLFINGAVIEGRNQDIFRRVTNRKSVLFFAVSWVGFAYLYPRRELFELPVWSYLTAFFISGTLFFLLLAGGIVGAFALVRKLGRRTVPVTPIVMLCVALLQVFKRQYAYYVWGPEWVDPSSLMMQIMTQSFAIIIFELIYSISILPHRHAPVVPKVESSPPAEKAAPDRVRIGKTEFQLAEIIMVVAEEHYVKVWLRGSSSLERDRISRVSESIPQHVGARVHRSYWVRFDSIVNVVRGKGGLTGLELENGLSAKVSKSYGGLVEQALKNR